MKRNIKIGGTGKERARWGLYVLALLTLVRQLQAEAEALRGGGAAVTQTATSTEEVADD
jgi:hypothetical protein